MRSASATSRTSHTTLDKLATRVEQQTAELTMLSRRIAIIEYALKIPNQNTHEAPL